LSTESPRSWRHLPMAETIADALPSMAAQRPGAVALWVPKSLKAKPPVNYVPVTFSELDAACTANAAALAVDGVGKGTRVALMVKPGLEFFALTFALFRLGAVPVLIDPGIGLKALRKCLKEAAPEVFIGIPAAHIARRLFGWGRGTVQRTVSVGGTGFWADVSLSALRTTSVDERWEPGPISGDDDAAILFTSGSTGVPKGALYKHRNFVEQTRMIRELYDIQPGEVDLPTFPLFALFAPALGMTAVIPPMDFTRPAKVNPAVLAEAIERFSVTTMFGSPALLDTLSRWTQSRGWHCSSLRRVISAGAPVPPKVMARLAEALPVDAQIVTPYGATESLPVASIESREVIGETAATSALGRGVCVGRVVPDAQVTIIAIDDGPIANEENMRVVVPGQVGEICVRSPAVTESYFGRPAATAAAKIRADDGSVIHRMGDLGWIDVRDRLWFCGRKSQRVRTADGDRYTSACEAVFNAHPQVLRSALVGVGEMGEQRAVLWVEREPDVPKAKRMSDANLRNELLEMGSWQASTQCIETVLFHRGFPVDIRHNAKIGREQLAVLAARRLG
jgi:acyl-CoA synthetase (AMP-forming)/AMP-acid ligase II